MPSDLRQSLRVRVEEARLSWRGSRARASLRHADVRAIARQYVPILVWARSYPQAWLQPDLVGGLTTWAVMIPSAMAYAQLAGVPAQYGLYAAMAAMAVYPLFGSSRHVRVTMSSTMAVMSASIVTPLAASTGDILTLTAALAWIHRRALLAAAAAWWRQHRRS